MLWREQDAEPDKKDQDLGKRTKCEGAVSKVTQIQQWRPPIPCFEQLDCHKGEQEHDAPAQ